MATTTPGETSPAAGVPADRQRWAGKAVLITGAASGIGRATARRFRSEGAVVVAVDVDEQGLAAVAGELDAVAVPADVSQPAVWPELVAAATAAGPLAVVHLNAGVTSGEPDLAALSDDAYRRILGVNVDHVVFGCRAFLPVLVAAGGGAVVATASLAGLVAFAGDPVYTATKHAVVGLVRALAPRYADVGVTLNAVCPGMVDTPLLTGEVRDMLVGAGIPLIDADRVAEAVVEVAAGRDSGQAVIVQAGREPTAYRFARPPGPRGEGAEGRVPPGLLGDPGQPRPPT